MDMSDLLGVFLEEAEEQPRRLDTLMNLVGELVIDRTRITRLENDLGLRYESEERLVPAVLPVTGAGRLLVFRGNRTRPRSG